MSEETRRGISEETEARIWKTRQEEGPEGLYRLGLRFERGDGVEQDWAAAKKCYGMAANQEHARAKGRLAELVTNDGGHDKRGALTLFHQAASYHDTQSECALAICYARGGMGLMKDEVRVHYWASRACGRTVIEHPFLYYPGEMRSDGEGAREAQLMEHYRDTFEAQRSFAERGFTGAQWDLGTRYEFGLGVERDYAQAAQWYRKAAMEGHPEAQCRLGLCYELGKGVEWNREYAAMCYRAAAEKGYAKANRAEAQRRLARLYASEEDGSAQIRAEALELFRQAAEQGDAPAQCALAVCYARGLLGAQKDNAESFKWINRLCGAEGGGESPQELLNRSFAYANESDDEEDWKEAMRCLELAAADGLAEAQYQLGLCYVEGRGKDHFWALAAACFRAASDQDHAGATLELGRLYASGDGVGNPNPKAALEMFHRAVELGNTDAMRELSRKEDAEPVEDQGGAQEAKKPILARLKELAGKLFRMDDEEERLDAGTEDGGAEESEEEPHREAVQEESDEEWHCEAVQEDGDVSQQNAGELYRMGRSYARGDGVAQDWTEAVKYYRQAAELGSADAQHALSLCYAQGKGVPRNNAEALKWYRRAMEAD